MRLPDIEIYLAHTTPEAIQNWLSQVLDPCSPWQQKGATLYCQSAEITVVWVEHALGKWHSLVFNSAHTPWADDLACAQAAHQALRCALQGWQEQDGLEDHLDWLEVSHQGTQRIRWHSA